MEALSKDYDIQSLCITMGVSRSGFYKWKQRKGIKNSYQLNRDDLKRLIISIHQEHRTWGYRRLAKHVREQYGWVVSNHYVHLICKELNIQSVVRRKKQKNYLEKDTRFMII